MTEEIPSNSQDPSRPGLTESVPHPVLRSGRLVLRPLVSSDAVTVQEICGDRGIAATTQNIPHPYPDGAALSWIESHAELWSSGQAAVFGICLTQDLECNEPRLVGAIGLEINSLDHRAELGYWLSREYWGQGICTEAVEMIIRFGFDQLGLQRIHAICMASNPASGRVLKKNGLTREGRLRSHVRKWGVFHDVDVYGTLRCDSRLANRVDDCG